MKIQSIANNIMTMKTEECGTQKLGNFACESSSCSLHKSVAAAGRWATKYKLPHLMLFVIFFAVTGHSVIAHAFDDFQKVPKFAARDFNSFSCMLRHLYGNATSFAVPSR